MRIPKYGLRILRNQRTVLVLALIDILG